MVLAAKAMAKHLRKLTPEERRRFKIENRDVIERWRQSMLNFKATAEAAGYKLNDGPSWRRF
jgi:hypothetical protein